MEDRGEPHKVVYNFLSPVAPHSPLLMHPSIKKIMETKGNAGGVNDLGSCFNFCWLAIVTLLAL
jgi:hypothetical protein